MSNTFTVIYKKGNKWHKCSTHFRSKESAYNKARDYESKGYKALVHDTDRLNSIGMPE